MASEVIKLNLIPSGEMPTFHCSQFDNGREIKIELYNGEDAYTLPTGYTAELHTRKMDNNIVTLSSTSVVSNLVTFTSTEQLTACAGNNLSEVSVKDASDYVVGTLNFWLYVEKDPLCGGLTSTSAIHDLTDQIEEITTEIVGENYYNKSETDDLLDLKADKATTYTKTETDTLLTAKADKTSVYTKTETNSLLAEKADADDVYTKSQVETKLSVKANAADVYTKSETDDLLDAKADANAVYTKTQVYNKTETDALLLEKADISDLATVATTGDYDDLINKPTIPAAQIQSDYAQADNTKVDYIKNKPDIDAMIAAALLAVMPVDSAGPSAIANFNTELAVDLVDCKTTLTPSLDGYSAVNLTACGVNLFNISTITPNKWLKDDYSGDMVDNNNYVVSDYIPVKPNTTYYKSLTGTSRSLAFNINKESISSGWLVGSPAQTFTTPNDCCFVRFSIANDNVSTFTMNYPSTDTTYHAYTGNAYAIALGNTYYGGTLDVTSGVLTVEYDSSLQPITPYDVQLTPTAVTARAGDNNVYSDTGDTSVKFKDSIQHYIDTH